MKRSTIKNNIWIRSVLLFTFFITLPFIFTQNANAYIDPNTGGLFFTSVLPFVYGILATVVIFWKRIALAIKNVFTGKKEKNDT